nr:Uncharacterised protein [Streptococcus thermophilus]
MKKFTSAFAAAALSVSLLTVPAAQAADPGSNDGSVQQAFSSGSSSGSSEKGVTKNKDNADKIPDDWKAPEEPPFGSAYLGFAPISVGLAFAALAILAGAVYNLPPVRKAVEDFTKNLPF